MLRASIKVLDVSPEKKHTTTPLDYSKATEHCFVDITVEFDSVWV